MFLFDKNAGGFLDVGPGFERTAETARPGTPSQRARNQQPKSMSSAARVAAVFYLVLFLAIRAVAFLLPVAGAMGGASPAQAAKAHGGADAAEGSQRPPLPPTIVAATTAAWNVIGSGLRTGSGLPSHLVVLAHGLSGTPEDLTYLKECLERRGGTEIVVHLARCNEGKTKDGVVEGGLRLAKEVLGVVESTPSLSRISFVGNSLGGLYVRYAAKLLYREDGGGGSTTSGDGEATHGSQTDARTVKAREHEAPGDASTSSSAGQQDAEPAAARTGGGTVAGLKPSVFMTIASPHLGVRRFTYVPLPPPLHPLAGVFVGKTGSDLFLSSKASSTRGCRQYPRSSSPRAADATSTASPVVPPGDANVANGGGGGGGREDPLLYQMATTQEFLRPLKAFRWRRVYANRRGDFMVPYETAAFVEHNEGDGSDAPLREDVVERGTGTHTRVRTGTSGFSFADHVLGAKQGAIVGMSRVPPAAAGGPDGVPSRSAAAAVSTVNKRSMSAGRTGVLARAKAPGARGGKKSMEAEMAAGLNSCGWEKVSVDFGGLLPFSHNKICALSRSPMTTTLYSSGKPIMDHAADFLVTHDRKDDDRGDQS